MKPLAAAIAWALIVLVPNSSRGMAIFGHPKDAASNQDSWDWRHDGIGADGAIKSAPLPPDWPAGLTAVPARRRGKSRVCPPITIGKQRFIAPPPRRPTGRLARRRRQAVLALARARHNCHLVFAGVAAWTASMAAPAKRGHFGVV